MLIDRLELQGLLLPLTVKLVPGKLDGRLADGHALPRRLFLKRPELGPPGCVLLLLALAAAAESFLEADGSADKVGELLDAGLPDELSGLGRGLGVVWIGFEFRIGSINNPLMVE